MANPNIVSVTSIYAGNAGWNLSSTLTATLLTVDADKIVKINSIICSNVDGTNSATLNLYVDGMGSGADGVTTTGADATIYIAKTITVPADATLVLIDKNSSIYLMEADVLKGGASAASDLDLFISYEIIDDA
tara:strand:+ start:344 stop:742 length:399 start_codon:yes stop_codon:yes gene_type:complete